VTVVRDSTNSRWNILDEVRLRRRSEPIRRAVRRGLGE
jgi:hypothetical protein